VPALEITAAEVERVKADGRNPAHCTAPADAWVEGTH
jgi:hypothetical protein